MIHNFKCQCFSHSLEIFFDEECNQFEFSFWKLGHISDTLSFWQRLRWCWKIISTGMPWTDSIILSKEQGKELVYFLDDILLKDGIKSGTPISRRDTIRMCRKIRRDAEKARKRIK